MTKPAPSPHALRPVDYTDDAGRTWRVLLPANLPEAEARMGIPVGPPPLDPLGLPHDIAVRLHNQLHARRLFTFADLRAPGRRADVQGAIQGALRLDAERLVEVYDAWEKGENG